MYGHDDEKNLQLNITYFSNFCKVSHCLTSLIVKVFGFVDDEDKSGFATTIIYSNIDILLFSLYSGKKTCL